MNEELSKNGSKVSSSRSSTISSTRRLSLFFPHLPFPPKPHTSTKPTRFTLILVAKLQTTPPTKPKATAAGAPTNPEAGVMQTRPLRTENKARSATNFSLVESCYERLTEIAPEQNPTALHFFSSLQSRRSQVKPPTDALRFVTMQAETARRLAERADPPLNPNHPNQRRTVPS